MIGLLPGGSPIPPQAGVSLNRWRPSLGPWCLLPAAHCTPNHEPSLVLLFFHLRHKSMSPSISTQTQSALDACAGESMHTSRCECETLRTQHADMEHLLHSVPSMWYEHSQYSPENLPSQQHECKILNAISILTPSITLKSPKKRLSRVRTRQSFPFLLNINSEPQIPCEKHDSNMVSLDFIHIPCLTCTRHSWQANIGGESP